MADSFIIISVTPPPLCRHKFFEDIVELRAQERTRTEAKRIEVLERRQRQMEELAEKRKGRDS